MNPYSNPHKVVSLGKMSRYSYGNEVGVFAPHKGVIVKSKEISGVIVTASAKQYLESLRASIEELTAHSPKHFAASVSTSVKYAEIAVGKLLDVLRWQEKLLTSSREIVIGVTTADNENVYVVGKRSVKKKKTSVLARIRSSLPVGNINIYQVEHGAVVYKVPYMTESLYEHSNITVGEMVNKEVVPKNYIIVMDSEHFRKYAGRTLLASKESWNEWTTKYDVPADTSVFFCNGHTYTEHTVDDLRKIKHSTLYAAAADHSRFAPVMEIITALAGRPENYGGFVATVYITDYAQGYYDFSEQMKQFLDKHGNAMVVFKRFGLGGRETIRRLQWRIGYDGTNPNMVRYEEDNVRVSDLLTSINLTWASTLVGVGVGDVFVFRATYDCSVNSIAAETKSEPWQFLVERTVSSELHYRNLSLCVVRGCVILATLPGASNFYCSVPTDLDKKFPVGTKFYQVSGDLSSLLAN